MTFDRKRAKPYATSVQETTVPIVPKNTTIMVLSQVVPEGYLGDCQEKIFPVQFDFCHPRPGRDRKFINFGKDFAGSTNVPIAPCLSISANLRCSPFTGISYRKYSCPLIATWTWSIGIHCGGKVLTASLGLRADTSIQASGVSTTSMPIESRMVDMVRTTVSFNLFALTHDPPHLFWSSPS